MKLLILCSLLLLCISCCRGAAVSADSLSAVSTARTQPGTRPATNINKKHLLYLSKMAARRATGKLTQQNTTASSQHSTTATATAGKAPRIVGGSTAPTTTSKYLAKVELHIDGVWVHQCTGTVVSSDRILSAAHCYDEATMARVDDVRVLVGIRYVGPDYEKQPDFLPYEVYSIHIARGYNSQIVESVDDVAIITIDDFFPDSQPFAALAQADRPKRTLVHSAGYGITDSLRSTDPTYVQQVDLRIRPFALCRRTLWPESARHRLDRFRMTCASAPVWRDGAKSDCTGDSGGPLFSTDARGRMVVLGVISFGPEVCGAPRTGSWYAKVPFYRSAILHHIHVGVDIETVDQSFWKETW